LMAPGAVRLALHRVMSAIQVRPSASVRRTSCTTTSSTSCGGLELHRLRPVDGGVRGAHHLEEIFWLCRSSRGCRRWRRKTRGAHRPSGRRRAAPRSLRRTARASPSVSGGWPTRGAGQKERRKARRKDACGESIRRPVRSAFGFVSFQCPPTRIDDDHSDIDSWLHSAWRSCVGRRLR
jgi:hypothetical protein